MIQSDALSRRANLCPKEAHDNENMILLPDHIFVKVTDTDLHTLIVEKPQWKTMLYVMQLKDLKHKGHHQQNPHCPTGKLKMDLWSSLTNDGTPGAIQNIRID